MSRDEFPQSVRKAALERSGGFCECGCGMPFTDHPKERPEYDHELPDFLGGTNDLENCKVIRRCCHLVKTRTYDNPKFSKVRREEKRRTNTEARKQKINGSRGTPWKRKLDGTTVPRD